jgi:hypothetical protein
MPPRWAYRQFLHSLEIDKAYEPAQDALLTIMAKWLSTLTIEERKRVKGIQVMFDSIEGDTFTAKLVRWSEEDASLGDADAAGSDAGSAEVPDGSGVRA